MKVKYVRWSTLAQSGSRQLLDKDKYDLVLKEQISGSIAFAKRPKGAKLLSMIEKNEVSELYVEEFSRLGRNAFDVLNTLQVCEENEVTVYIQDMDLKSRVNGRKNPIFKMLSHILTVVAEQEREQIKERTEAGKLAARERGIVFGRKSGSNERKADFMAKEKTKQILKYLKPGTHTIRDISTLTGASTATILKVKRTAQEMKQM